MAARGVTAFGGGSIGLPLLVLPAAVPAVGGAPVHVTPTSPHQPVGPMGAPTSGHSPTPCQLPNHCPHPGERPPPHPPQPVCPVGPRAPVQGGGGGGSLAALPQLMLHLGTGIYPLAQLGAINSCWDGRQGCSGCQHQPSTGLRGSSQSPADPHPPHRPTVLAVMGPGCPVLSPMGAHLPPGGVSLPPPAPPKILALLWAL